MIRRTRSYLLTVLAVVVATGLAHPSAAGPPPRAAAAVAPTLTGTVVLSGTKTGYVPVTVAKDMTLGNPFVTKHRGAVTMTGGGEAAGFALVEDGLKGTILVGGQSSAFAPYVEKFGVVVNSLGRNPKDGVTFAVPAGDYRLYLITGGKPTSVTLRFTGGSRTTSRLAPTTKVESVVQQVDLTSPAPGPVGGIYSGGGAVTLTTPVLQLSLNRLDTSVHTESVQRYCYYYGKPTGPQPYGPACLAPAEDVPVVFDPLGSTFIVSAEGVGSQSFYGWNASLTTSTSGEPVKATIASGVSYTTAGVVTNGDYAQYWLSLDGAAAAAPPRAPSPQQPPAEQPPAAPPTEGAPETAAETLPVTGLPSPLLALAPALLAAAAATRRSRSQTR